LNLREEKGKWNIFQ